MSLSAGQMPRASRTDLVSDFDFAERVQHEGDRCLGLQCYHHERRDGLVRRAHIHAALTLSHDLTRIVDLEFATDLHAVKLPPVG